MVQCGRGAFSKGAQERSQQAREIPPRNGQSFKKGKPMKGKIYRLRICRWHFAVSFGHFTWRHWSQKSWPLPAGSFAFGFGCLTYMRGIA